MEQKIVIKGKTAFYLFIITCIIVIATIWITGLDIHRTVSNNAFYSLTIITFIFFAFVTFGLYRGIGLTDNFGSIKNKFESFKPSGNSVGVPDGELIGGFASDGLEGIILGILA